MPDDRFTCSKCGQWRDIGDMRFHMLETRICSACHSMKGWESVVPAFAQVDGRPPAALASADPRETAKREEELLRALKGASGELVALGAMLGLWGGVTVYLIPGDAEPLFGLPRHLALGGAILALGAAELGSGVCLRLTRHMLFAWTGAIGATLLALGWIGLPMLYGRLPLNLLTLLLVLLAGKFWQRAIALLDLEARASRT